MTKQTITIKELEGLNDRLNNILKSDDRYLNNSRLRSLQLDIDNGWDIDNDKRARFFYMRVGEELSETLKGVYRCAK